MTPFAARLRAGLAAPALRLGLQARSLARLANRLPYPLALWVLWLASLYVPISPALRRYAQEQLGLRGLALRRWCRRAWWGHRATWLSSRRLAEPSTRATVLARCLPIDWSPVRALLAEGRGLLLVNSHLGVPHVLCGRLAAEITPPLRLNRSTLFQHHRADLSRRRNPDYLTSVYAQAFVHLRGGGIVSCAGDGRGGGRYRDVPLLGGSVPIGVNLARLSRLTAAPTLFNVVRWESNRMLLEFSEPVRVPDDADEEWESRWIDAYARWIESLCRGFPEVQRLNQRLFRSLSDVQRPRPCG